VRDVCSLMTAASLIGQVSRGKRIWARPPPSCCPQWTDGLRVDVVGALRRVLAPVQSLRYWTVARLRGAGLSAAVGRTVSGPAGRGSLSLCRGGKWRARDANGYQRDLWLEVSIAMTPGRAGRADGGRCRRLHVRGFLRLEHRPFFSLAARALYAVAGDRNIAGSRCRAFPILSTRR